MYRKFLALLGLLVSLSIMVPAAPAAARVYNQEVATATNLVRTTYGISEDEARGLDSGWPPVDTQHPAFATPVITKATPSIWQSMRARLEALEAVGVTDSATRVAQATSPDFVFPDAVVSAHPVTAPVAPAAPAPAKNATADQPNNVSDPCVVYPGSCAQHPAASYVIDWNLVGLLALGALALGALVVMVLNLQAIVRALLVAVGSAYDLLVETIFGIFAWVFDSIAHLIITTIGVLVPSGLYLYFAFTAHERLSAMRDQVAWVLAEPLRIQLATYLLPALIALSLFGLVCYTMIIRATLQEADENATEDSSSPLAWIAGSTVLFVLLAGACGFTYDARLATGTSMFERVLSTPWLVGVCAFAKPFIAIFGCIGVSFYGILLVLEIPKFLASIGSTDEAVTASQEPETVGLIRPLSANAHAWMQQDAAAFANEDGDLPETIDDADRHQVLRSALGRNATLDRSDPRAPRFGSSPVTSH